MGSRGWIVVGWWRDCGVVTDGAVGCDVVVAGLWRGCGWVVAGLWLGWMSSSLRKTTSSGSDLAFPTEGEVGSRKARSWRGHATKCHHTVATPDKLVV